MTTFFVQQAVCFVPGKGKPGTQPALPPTQPGTGAAVVCQRSTSSTSPLTPPPPPLAPHSALRLRLSSLAIVVTHAAHAGGAAPTQHSDLLRSAEPGTSPFPKLFVLKFQCGMELGGLLHCAQLILKVRCIYLYVCTHPLPFLPSLPCYFFSCSVFLSLSVSPPTL